MSTGSLTEKVKDPPFSSHFQEKARRDLPVAGLLPQCLKHSGLLQVKAGSPDLNVSLSGGWGTHVPEPSPLPLGDRHMIRKLSDTEELELKPGTLLGNCQPLCQTPLPWSFLRFSCIAGITQAFRIRSLG